MGTDCSPLKDFQFALGWVLLASTVGLAYAPQWIKQCRMRSHIGMSLSNFLCATFVSYLQVLNYICCKHQDTFRCCGDGYSARRCLAALQPVMQTASACLCYAVVVVLYFVFFDCEGLASRGRDPAQALVWARRKLLLACFIALALVAVLLVLVAVSGGTGSERVYSFGVFSEVAASAILVLHWFLQMWETWAVQSIGSLSIFGLMVGCIGNLLNAYSLGVHGGFAVGASNLVAALMIGCTCGLGIYVEKIKTKLQPREPTLIEASSWTSDTSGRGE